MVVVTNGQNFEAESMLENKTNEQIADKIITEHSDSVFVTTRTRLLETKKQTVKDPTLALQLLKTAIDLGNLDLIRQCVEIIDDHLEKTILVTIFSHLSLYTNITALENVNNLKPSAPPINDKEDLRTFPYHGIAELINNLRHNCLLEIDKNADFVLRQKETLELDFNDIYEITTRDTLQVSNELLVYSTIIKWARVTCLKKKLDPSEKHMREILRELIYAPRFGLLTKKTFMAKKVFGEKGPTRNDILDKEYCKEVLIYIESKNKKLFIDELPFKGSVPRIICNVNAKILSCRSISKSVNSCKENSKLYQRNKCEKCLINFLTCWTFVFD